MKATCPALIALCAMTAALCCESRTETWKTFDSKAQRFRVRYPGSWNRVTLWDGKPASQDSLEIINFPITEAVKGVFLIASGAEIQAGRAPGDVTTIEDWIRRGTGPVERLEQREIPISIPPSHGCARLVRLTTREQIGPDGGSFIYTEYFCSTDTGLYLVSLHNWEGNPQQKQFEAVALKIVMSLKSC
jgi:hypothetical protein